MSDTIISISGIQKEYDGGFKALKGIDLDIKKGEIFALLGPNGAGKTTLISTICGLVRPTAGQIKVGGHDIIESYKAARNLIGLVPQELTTDAFETVLNTVNFTRGLFGLVPNPEYIESILKKLSLWDKKDNRLMSLSGGMKRRLMIAKALSHEPKVLFLDEPTAGVDVELRRDMWKQVQALRESGVTIILTTHYIEEAEEMADRIGVINKGSIIVVEDKENLIQKLGSKELRITLTQPLKGIPSELSSFNLSLKGSVLTYLYDSRKEDTGITSVLEAIKSTGLTVHDLKTKQSSLEDIFVELVRTS
jgi:ABC-2 type transport system ATP-binding protein